MKLLVLVYCLLLQASLSQKPIPFSEGLTESEKEAIQKAKDSGEQLRLYLEIANERLKTILSLARRGDKDNTAKAVTGFRTAVSGAEERVAKAEVGSKNTRKLLTTLLKATRKYNFSLVQALEKVPEELREQIQLAYEVSQRVSDGAELQFERLSK